MSWIDLWAMPSKWQLLLFIAFLMLPMLMPKQLTLPILKKLSGSISTASVSIVVSFIACLMCCQYAVRQREQLVFQLQQQILNGKTLQIKYHCKWHVSWKSKMQELPRQKIKRQRLWIYVLHFIPLRVFFFSQFSNSEERKKMFT